MDSKNSKLPETPDVFKSAKRSVRFSKSGRRSLWSNRSSFIFSPYSNSKHKYLELTEREVSPFAPGSISGEGAFNSLQPQKKQENELPGQPPSVSETNERRPKNTKRKLPSQTTAAKERTKPAKRIGKKAATKMSKIKEKKLSKATKEKREAHKEGEKSEECPLFGSFDLLYNRRLNVEELFRYLSSF